MMMRIGSFFVLVCVFLVAGCVGLKVAEPQKGGEAALVGMMNVRQPENSSGVTVVEYERDILTNIVDGWAGLSNQVFSNCFVLRERMKTEFSGHQADEARSGFAKAQGIAAKLSGMGDLRMAGAGFIFLGIVLAVLKKYFPVGIKVVFLCIGVGVVLCLLPALAVSESMQIVMALVFLAFCGVFVAMRNFSSSEQGKTLENSKEDK